MVIALDDLFQVASAKRSRERVLASREYEVCASIAAACFLESPSVPVWQWAAENVWLDEVMAARQGFYDPDFTPWTKEIQELPLRPEVRVAALMKSSRSGGSEAGLNILRYMPSHWPGNAGICFPEDKQGRDVTKRRILKSLERVAGSRMSDDPQDTGLSNIYLDNMMIKMGPSGSARLFTEWWVRYFMLDEIEEHSTADSTATWERAMSRQVDVPDSLLYALSKPKHADGPIALLHARGSQKQWLVPCPRCERRFAFARGQFTNDPDCKKADGTWDLELVKRATFCLCPHCQGRIEEKEKRMMNDAAVWTPRPLDQRLRLSDGKYIPPTPGWESYHITDYCSYHEKVAWGELRVMELLAFEIQPTRSAQVHFTNNHEGLPEEPDLTGLDAKSIDQLVAGRIETRFVTAADGSKREEHITHGIPGGYFMAYKAGREDARLPFVPHQIVIFIDKQMTHLKCNVFAIRLAHDIPGQCEAFHIDRFRCDDEEALEALIIARTYHTMADDTAHFITAGFMDSRHRGQEVFKFCLRMYYTRGINIWPVRGEGVTKPFQRKRHGGSDADEEHSRDTSRSKIIRYVKDMCDLGELTVRYFKDHALQLELEAKLARKPGWRLWLAKNYPPEFAAELTAEKYDPHADRFVHHRNKFGPNDDRDCTKYLVLWLIEHLPLLLQTHHITPPPPPPPPEPESKAREYVLKANE